MSKRNHFWVVESQNPQNPEEYWPTCDGHCIQIEARGLLEKRKHYYPNNNFCLRKYESTDGGGV